jgi:GTPase SAR1 family protein
MMRDDIRKFWKLPRKVYKGKQLAAVEGHTHERTGDISTPQPTLRSQLDLPKELKVVVVGERGVGKTSVAVRVSKTARQNE